MPAVRLNVSTSGQRLRIRPWHMTTGLEGFDGIERQEELSQTALRIM